MSGETFETLLAPDLNAIRRLVHARVRTAGNAEDVLQEVLLRAFSRRNQLRVQARFRTWLWSIALNQIRTFFRRDRGVLSLDDFPNLDARDPAISPLARLERVERREWLRAGMAKLPERDQQVIQLLDLEGRSIRDAAAALHRSESAIKTAHFRARKRLSNTVRARTAQRN